MKLQRVQNCLAELPGLLVPLTQCHFFNQCYPASSFLSLSATSSISVTRPPRSSHSVPLLQSVLPGLLVPLTQCHFFNQCYPASSFLSLSATSSISVTRPPRSSHSVPLLQSVLPGLLVPLTQCHFFNQCIGFSRSAPLKHFHPSNQHIYIKCSHLQDSPGSFDHLVLINFSFSVLRHPSELELSQLPHKLCEIHFLLALSRQQI